MSEAFVRVTAVRWVDDEPFPGVVEVELTDADGHRWTFIDKWPVFDAEGVLSPSAPYPLELRLACTVVERGDDRVVISTAQPWGVESVDGQSEFVTHLTGSSSSEGRTLAQAGVVSSATCAS